MRFKMLLPPLLSLAAFSVQTTGFAQATRQAQPSAVSTTDDNGLLSQKQMDDLFPASVFFAGKTVTTQVRNSGGVQAGEDNTTAFALVDASGYSSGLRERFQFYLLSSVAIELAGKRVDAGAYGGGFVNGQVLLMDLSGKELFHAPVTADAGMKRPRPLQVTTTASPAEYRLYLGREYVSLRQILRRISN